MHLLSSMVGISPITVSPSAPWSSVLTDHDFRLEYFTKMCKYIESELFDHPHIIAQVGGTNLGENNVLPRYRTGKQTFFAKSICLIPTTEAEIASDEIWHSERISWDGFDNLNFNGDFVTGLA